AHVLVRIKAAALNARDLMVISRDSASYPGPHAPDLVPCADGAGIVEAVGEGSKWKEGERVIVSPASWLTGGYASEQLLELEQFNSKGAGESQGTLGEYLVVPDEELVRGPAYLSFEDLAAIPAAGATAIHALFHGPKPLKKGQTVLAQGTGGVSCFVIQLAAAFGATVIATSSSDAKLAQARALGATHTINYTTHPTWSAEVQRLTANRGVDHVVDIAGAGTIEQSIASTKLGGVVTLVGFLSESKKTDVVMSVIFRAVTVYGLRMYTVEMIEECVRLMEGRELRPAVEKVWGWGEGEVRGAFEMLREGRAVGKVVVKV
ncbi:hypothetical protein BDV95DRAFT_443003, partial [Massariosphaeria phaeospora]